MKMAHEVKGQGQMSPKGTHFYGSTIVAALAGKTLPLNCLLPNTAATNLR